MAAWVVPSPAVIRYRDPSAADSTWRLLRAYAARYRAGRSRACAGLHASSGRCVASVDAADLLATRVGCKGDLDVHRSPDAARRRGRAVRRLGRHRLSVPSAGSRRSDGARPPPWCARGCASLSDGTTVLDPDTLEVLPVPRPISRQPAAALSTIEIPDEPLETRLLVFVEHAPHASGLHVEVVPGGEAAYLLGSRSARLGDVTGGALPALARLARRVPAYRLRYDDAARAAEEVLRLWPTP